MIGKFSLVVLSEIELLGIRETGSFSADSIINSVDALHEVHERSVLRALSELRSNKLVYQEKSGDIHRYGLTDSGSTALELFKNRISEAVAEFENYGNPDFSEQFEITIHQSNETDIPASDRYVDISDNQRQEMLAATETLKLELSESRLNDFPDQEERLAEIAAFELLISQPRVSEPLFARMLDSTFKHLAVRFAETAIGVAALTVLKLGANLMGIELPI